LSASKRGLQSRARPASAISISTSALPAICAGCWKQLDSGDSRAQHHQTRIQRAMVETWLEGDLSKWRVENLRGKTGRNKTGLTGNMVRRAS
jgi:hypothetical protein